MEKIYDMEIQNYSVVLRPLCFVTGALTYYDWSFLGSVVYLDSEKAVHYNTTLYSSCILYPINQ
jgi:hypothetical protein